MKYLYAAPRKIDDIDSCYFYHTIDLPDVGTVEGNWDLRQNIKSYLGNIEFKGKRVLDVGCANGALSFYMEKQGAEVISYDLDKNGDWDVVPFAKCRDYDDISLQRKAHIDKLNNAFWFSHSLLKSKAKVVYGSVYEIPDAIGFVDISVYGSILLHVRDPFLALQNGLKLTKDTVVIAEPLRKQSLDIAGPYLGLLPNSRSISAQ
jgi:SAM-dependent methyltransferase